MDFSFLLPYSLEILVSVLIVALITCDTTLDVEEKSTVWGVGSLGLLAILAVSFFLPGVVPAEAGDRWVCDSFAIYFKRFFLMAALFVMLQVRAFAHRFRHGEAEYYNLVLMVTLGGMILTSAMDWITLFVGLELMTVTLFILVSWARRDGKSLEAGMKYVIIGTFSAAFLLYGIAYLYGYSGTIKLGQLAQYLEYHREGLDDGVVFGILLVFSGLAFKMAAFPFHVWAPDVYEGAPTPTTSLLSTASKGAGFVLGMRLIVGVFGSVRNSLVVPVIEPTWTSAAGFEARLVVVTLLGFIAAVTVAYGSLAAIPQWNIKRLLGYSSISHAGYLLIGLAAGSQLGVTAVCYYLIAYLFTNGGLFMVLCCLDRYSNDYEVESLGGLGRRSPLLGITMTFALLSLAGIPPFGGFFGKLLLLMSAFEQGMYWVGGVGMLMVVVSMYVYLGVLKQVYAVEPRDPESIEVDGWSSLGCYIACAGMVLTGVFQQPFLTAAERAAASLF